MEKFLSRWLDAHQDTSANLTTLSQLITFSDVQGSGEHRLVLAHLQLTGNERSRLKTYRGPSLTSDLPLQDTPSGVVSFYHDSHEPRFPAVAVSCGPHVLLFKNNKPFFKFTLPSLPTSALEIDIWQQLTSRDLHANIPDLLNSLRAVPYTELSSRSQRLLTLSTEQLKEFIDRYQSTGNTGPSRMSVITCLTTINKNSLNKDSVACLVLATEHGQIYVLDPQGFHILHQASVNSTSAAPSHLCCSGMFDIEYRMIIGCRDGSVCVLRRDWFEGRILMHVPDKIVDIQLMPDNCIMVASYSQEILCFSKKGKKLWTLPSDKQISCLCLVNLPHLSTTLLGVGLWDGPFQLYQGKRLVDFIPTNDTVAAAKFGHLGQEENVLVIVTQRGSLMFKILKRTADFSLTSPNNNNIPIDYQIKPLPLPKRSKLFAEQVQRERENTVQIHHTFQQDLIRLRLTTARSLVQLLQTQDQNVVDVKQPIKMSAQVLGLGPKFTLIITLENTSSERAVSNLNLILHTQIKKYKIQRSYTQVPMLTPGISYNIQTMVEEQLTISNNTNEESDEVPIKVFVFVSGHTQPLLAATINMPPTDPLGYV